MVVVSLLPGYFVGFVLKNYAKLTVLNDDSRYAGVDTGREGARAAPSKIRKNMIFWRKNRDFSHEIPQNFSRLPPLGSINP
jgi:hypothetical protein